MILRRKKTEHNFGHSQMFYWFCDFLAAMFAISAENSVVQAQKSWKYCRKIICIFGPTVGSSYKDVPVDVLPEALLSIWSWYYLSKHSTGLDKKTFLMKSRFVFLALLLFDLFNKFSSKGRISCFEAVVLIIFQHCIENQLLSNCSL